MKKVRETLETNQPKLEYFTVSHKQGQAALSGPVIAVFSGLETLDCLATEPISHQVMDI